MNRSFVEEEDKKRSTSTGKETNLFSNSIQFSSVTQSCPTLGDPMDCSTTGLPVHHQLPEFTQTHVHRISDAIQPSHPLSSPSPSAPNPSQHQEETLTQSESQFVLLSPKQFTKQGLEPQM